MPRDLRNMRLPKQPKPEHQIVQAFIPDWPGEGHHTQELLEKLEPLCSVTVMDNPDHWFVDQWNLMMSKFTGDIMLWVMADASLKRIDVHHMYAEMLRFFFRGDVGVYAPNLCWTIHGYKLGELTECEPQVYEVPITDLVCLAVRADILKAMGTAFHPETKLGWGVDAMLSAICRINKKKVLRDYRFFVEHPMHTGYNVDKAQQEYEGIMGTDSPYRDAMRDIVEEAVSKRLLITPEETQTHEKHQLRLPENQPKR